MNRTLLLLIAGLVAVLAIPLMLGGTGIFHQLVGFPPELFLFMLGMILLGWNLNAIKLRLLLAGRAERFGHFSALGVVMATEFAICATPGGTGGPLTLVALLTRRGVRPARATAVFAVDQMIDMVFFLSAMLALMIYIVTRAIDIQLGWLLGLPMLLLATSLVAITLLGRYHRGVIRLLGKLLARLSIKRPMRLKLTRRLLTFRNALVETLRLPRHLLTLAFLISVAHWMLRYSVLYLALRGLGQYLDWGWTFLVQMLSLAAGQITLLPGGAGGAEISASALLTPQVGQATAAAAILIWRSVTYYFYLLAGGPVFMILAGRPLLRRILHAHDKK